MTKTKTRSLRTMTDLSQVTGGYTLTISLTSSQLSTLSNALKPLTETANSTVDNLK